MFSYKLIYTDLSEIKPKLPFSELKFHLNIECFRLLLVKALILLGSLSKIRRVKLWKRNLM